MTQVPYWIDLPSTASLSISLRGSSLLLRSMGLKSVNKPVETRATGLLRRHHPRPTSNTSATCAPTVFKRVSHRSIRDAEHVHCRHRREDLHRWRRLQDLRVAMQHCSLAGCFDSIFRAEAITELHRVFFEVLLRHHLGGATHECLVAGFLLPSESDGVRPRLVFSVLTQYFSIALTPPLPGGFGDLGWWHGDASKMHMSVCGEFGLSCKPVGYRL